MIVLEFTGCTSIDDAIAEAIANAKRAGSRVEFRFNSTRIIVAEDSDHSLIWRDWYRSTRGCLGKSPSIGPYPSELTELDKARDRLAVANANVTNATQRLAAARQELRDAATNLTKLQEAKT